jgi:hypothetical protein
MSSARFRGTVLRLKTIAGANRLFRRPGQNASLPSAQMHKFRMQIPEIRRNPTFFIKFTGMDADGAFSPRVDSARVKLHQCMHLWCAIGLKLGTVIQSSLIPFNF